MDSDFKPPERPARSLRHLLDSRKTQTPDQNDFRTPDEVAAADDVNQPVELPASATAPTPVAPNGKNGWKQKLKQAFHFSWPPGRKEYLTAAVVLLLIGGGVSYALTRPPTPPPTVAKARVKPPAKPKTVASTLTGLQVDPSVNQRPVTGVMIENSLDARPQSGLGQAGVVFEAIAEGGITRFLALYQDTAPDNIGPVRSARPYYLQWNLGFDAGYAHVGGSPEALANIKAWGVRDLDQFFNAGAYRRVSNRPAPHNVYTSAAALNQLEAAKGYTSSKYSGFVRKPTEQPAKVPAAKSINLNVSGTLYNVHYDYVAASNSYNRSEGGAAHIEANTNTQISPKVVIALVIPYNLAADGVHSQYGVVGSGPVYVFQDGGVATGTWSKPSAANQLTFSDAAGKPIRLNPGQTWLTAVTDGSKVVATP